MSFAQILDVPVSGHFQPNFKSVRAAGFALRHLASTDEQLLNATRVVDGQAQVEASALSRQLRTDFANVLDAVADATGVPVDEVCTALVAQLRQVVAFANLDGGALEANVGAVAKLIRSGRIELFAG